MDQPSTSKINYDLAIETNRLARIPRGYIKKVTNKQLLNQQRRKEEELPHM
jgi:hypothetical protein